MTLHDAARAGDLAALRDRIAAGEPVDGRDDEGRTPLMVAAETGRLDPIHALIEAGAQPDATATARDPDPKALATGPDERTVIRYGLFELIWPIVRAEQTIKARRRTADGPTPLMIAAAADRAAAVEALLAAGAAPDLRDRDGFTALAYAATLGRAEVVRVLIGAGAETDPVDHYEMTPIILAALFGHAEAVGVLASAGAGLTAPKPSTLPPLHAAARHGHVETVRTLIAAGADPNALAFNVTPLGMALDRGHTEVVRTLAHGGTALDRGDWRGLTPLMAAVARADGAALHILLEAGADPDAKVGMDGEEASIVRSLPERATALHLAACLGDPGLVAALLSAGADPHARDASGFTPLMLAAAGGRDEAARLLREAGPPGEDELPALRPLELVGAVRRGDLGRVRDLLASGVAADVRTPDTFKYHYLLHCEASGDDSFGEPAEGEASIRDAGRPLLSLAVELGHDAIAALLAAGAGEGSEAGAPMDVRDGEGRTPLMDAARKGDAGLVADLIAAGADADAVDRERRTALADAAEEGHADVVRMLLDAGAKVRPGDLALAAVGGHVDVTRTLLEAGRSRGIDPAPSTLARAVWSHSADVLRLLLDAGFDPDAREEDGAPALVSACRTSPELARLLVDAGADVNARGPNGLSALSAAVAFMRVDLVRFLLEQGADTEGRMDGVVKGETPLIRAAGQGLAVFSGRSRDPDEMARLQAQDEAMIRLLIEHGADLGARDHEDGLDALMHAAAKGRESAVRMLIEAGAEVDARDANYGRTPLGWAAVGGHAGVARLLIEAGADPEAEDSDGLTPAALAAREGKFEMEAIGHRAESPIRAGVSPSRALREAAEAGDAAAIQSALDAGIDPDTRFSSGRTALLVAVEKGRVDAIGALLDAGADPNARDREGTTPLIAAIQARSPETVRLLLRAGADPNGRGRTIEGLGPEVPLVVAISDRSNAVGSAWLDVLNGSREAYEVGEEQVAIVRDLIAAGASVHAEDELGSRPVWYAIDMGQGELADLLVEAGAGRDPVGTSYLRARTFAAAAASEPFRTQARLVAELCGAEAEPFHSRPTHADFRDLRRGGGFPTGPIIGSSYAVSGDQADALVAANQEALRHRGVFLCRSRTFADGYSFERQRLALLPTGDKYDVIAAVCNAGTDWGWVSPGFYIRDLRALEPDYPFALIGCEPRSLEIEFTEPIADPADLARRLRAIRTTLGGPGLPEYPNVDDIAEFLARQTRISFYWE